MKTRGKPSAPRARKRTGSPLGSLVLRNLGRGLAKKTRSRGDSLKRPIGQSPWSGFFANSRLSPPRVPVPPKTLPATVPAAAPPSSVPFTLPPVVAEPLAASAGSLLVHDLLSARADLRQHIEAFLLDQRSEHTRRAYGKDLKRFVKYLHLRAMEKGRDEPLTRSVVIAYKDFLLGEKLQHTSIDRHLATLRSFFQWLVDDGVLDRSPAQGVRFLNPRKLSATVGLSDDEVRKILQQPDLHTRSGAQHYAILMLLFFCGLRRSELCSIRTRQLQVERGIPVLRLRGKGNAERLIAVPEAAWNAIRYSAHIARRDLSRDQWLFTPLKNPRGGGLDRALDPSGIFYLVRRYAKLAGIQSRISPHSCRATAISNARDRHVPDRAIQEFAGWASPDMITRYDKRRTAAERSASRAIDYGSSDRVRAEKKSQFSEMEADTTEQPTALASSPETLTS